MVWAAGLVVALWAAAMRPRWLALNLTLLFLTSICIQSQRWGTPARLHDRARLNAWTVHVLLQHTVLFGLLELYWNTVERRTPARLLSQVVLTVTMMSRVVRLQQKNAHLFPAGQYAMLRATHVAMRGFHGVILVIACLYLGGC